MSADPHVKALLTRFAKLSPEEQAEENTRSFALTKLANDLAL